MPEDLLLPPPEHLRARIVVQAHQRHATKVAEGTFVPVEDDIKSLMRVCPRPQPMRIAEREDEQMNHHLNIANPEPELAEIDLCLLPRRRLESHGRQGRPLPARAQRLQIPLHLQVAPGKAQAL